MTPSIQTWVPGLAIADYVLVRELARGGMGEIWLARQSTPQFERLVVLKRVIGDGGDDSTAVTMFLDEARIASKLSHPNVVQVFELGREGSSVFLVMEYLAGQTLSRFARKMIEADGRVPPALAVSIIAAAARGLGYAHRRVGLDGKPLHIVHRDVSPQNLFVTYDGEVKVLDFGIARAAGRMVKTLTGVVKGKVAYMSPEQASGGAVEVTGAADVYALGIVLFELLTGTRFYKGLDDLGMLRRLAISARAPELASRGVSVDPALEALVVRALEPEAVDRFVDGETFFEALDAWLRANPPRASEPSLRAVMQRLFASDIEALGQFQAEAAAMVALPTQSSMPDKSAAPLPPRGPVGPSSMVTDTSPLPPEPVRPASIVTAASATPNNSASPPRADRGAQQLGATAESKPPAQQGARSTDRAPLQPGATAESPPLRGPQQPGATAESPQRIVRDVQQPGATAESPQRAVRDARQPGATAESPSRAARDEQQPAVQGAAAESPPPRGPRQSGASAESPSRAVRDAQQPRGERARRGRWALPLVAIVAVVGIGAAWRFAPRGEQAVSAPPPTVTPTPAPPTPKPVAEPVPGPIAAEPTAAAQPDAGAKERVAEPVRPAPSAARAKPGALSLNTEPWTRVFLGKKSLGDTPLIEFPLPSGTHRLRLVNEGEKIDQVIEVTIKPSETTIKKFAF
ncbi:MAG: protein kinase [Archangium sp.]